MLLPALRDGGASVALSTGKGLAIAGPASEIKELFKKEEPLEEPKAAYGFATNTKGYIKTDSNQVLNDALLSMTEGMNVFNVVSTPGRGKATLAEEILRNQQEHAHCFIFNAESIETLREEFIKFCYPRSIGRSRNMKVLERYFNEAVEKQSLDIFLPKRAQQRYFRENWFIVLDRVKVSSREIDKQILKFILMLYRSQEKGRKYALIMNTQSPVMWKHQVRALDGITSLPSPKVHRLKAFGIPEIKSLMMDIDEVAYQALARTEAFERSEDVHEVSQLEQLRKITDGNPLDLRHAITTIYSMYSHNKAEVADVVSRYVEERKCFIVTGLEGGMSKRNIHGDLIHSLADVLRMKEGSEDYERYVKFFLLIGALSQGDGMVPDRLLRKVLISSNYSRKKYNEIIRELQPRFIEKIEGSGLTSFSMPIAVQQVVRSQMKDWLKRAEAETEGAMFSKLLDPIRSAISSVSGFIKTSNENKHEMGKKVLEEIRILFLGSSRPNQLLRMLKFNIESLYGSELIKKGSQQEFELINLWGDILYELKELDQARKIWLKLFDDKGKCKFMTEERRSEIANTHRKIGLVYFNENYAQALACYNTSEKMYMELDGSKEEVRTGLRKTRLNIALVDFEQEKFEDAAKIFREEMPAYFGEAPDLLKFAHVYGNYGEHLYKLGRYEDAKRYTTEAIKASLATFIKEKEPRVNFTTNFANHIRLLLIDGAVDKAQECAEFALKVNMHFCGKKSRHTAEILLAYAEVLKAKKDFSGAEEKCMAAKSSFSAEKNRLKIAETLTLLAEIHMGQNDSEHDDKALKLLREAHKIQVEFFPEGNHTSIAKTYWLSAKIRYKFAQMGTTTGRDYEWAEKNIKIAFKAYSQANHLDAAKILGLFLQICKLNTPIPKDKKALLLEYKEIVKKIFEERALEKITLASPGDFPGFPKEVSDKDISVYLEEARVVMEANKTGVLDKKKIRAEIKEEQSEDEDEPTSPVMTTPITMRRRPDLRIRTASAGAGSLDPDDAQTVDSLTARRIDETPGSGALSTYNARRRVYDPIEEESMEDDNDDRCRTKYSASMSSWLNGGLVSTNAAEAAMSFMDTLALASSRVATAAAQLAENIVTSAGR